MSLAHWENVMPQTHFGTAGSAIVVICDEKLPPATFSKLERQLPLQERSAHEPQNAKEKSRNLTTTPARNIHKRRVKSRWKYRGENSSSERSENRGARHIESGILGKVERIPGMAEACPAVVIPMPHRLFRRLPRCPRSICVYLQCGKVTMTTR